MERLVDISSCTITLQNFSTNQFHPGVSGSSLMRFQLDQPELTEGRLMVRPHQGSFHRLQKIVQTLGRFNRNQNKLSFVMRSE